MAEHAGENGGRKTFDRGVVGLHGLVEAAAFDGDAVLGAFELCLEVATGGGGCLIGIVCGLDEQPRRWGTEVRLGALGVVALARRRTLRG